MRALASAWVSGLTFAAAISLQPWSQWWIALLALSALCGGVA